MKNFILGSFAFIIFLVICFLILLWVTSPKQWYAGQHTKGCNGTKNCGCYEKLVASEMK
jgi:hypothetical protein